MIKTVTLILLSVLMLSLVAKPAWEKLNQVVNKDRRGDFEESRIIGITSIYNPRVKEVQQILKSIDLYEHDVDGIMGDATRTSIREFQVKNKLAPNGRVNELTWLALVKTKVSVDLRQYPPDVGEHRVVVPVAPPVLPVAAPRIVTPIEKLPVAASVTSTKVSSRKKSKHLNLSKDQIKYMQRTLTKLGFYKGKIDGVAGSKTSRAVIAFQKSRGLKPDGVVGAKTWGELSKNK